MSCNDVSVVELIYFVCVCVCKCICRFYFMKLERIINEPLQCLPRVSSFLLRSFFRQFVCGFFNFIFSSFCDSTQLKSNETAHIEHWTNFMFDFMVMVTLLSHFEWQITRKIAGCKNCVTYAPVHDDQNTVWIEWKWNKFMRSKRFGRCMLE